MTTIGHDCVVAALHVFDCCGGVMALGRIGACAACVIAVESQAMCPTVVHVETIIGDNGMCAATAGVLGVGPAGLGAVSIGRPSTLWKAAWAL